MLPLRDELLGRGHVKGHVTLRWLLRSVSISTGARESVTERQHGGISGCQELDVGAGSLQAPHRCFLTPDFTVQGGDVCWGCELVVALGRVAFLVDRVMATLG